MRSAQLLYKFRPTWYFSLDGQPNYPLNNQWWAQCGGFLFDKMDPDFPYTGCGTFNECSPPQPPNP